MTLTDAEVAALEKFLRTQWIGDDTMRGVVAKLQAHVSGVSQRTGEETI